MDTTDIFSAASTSDAVPRGDAERQAVDSLRGYVYQTLAAALAWVDIGENSRLYLEVAEDYLTVADQALRAVQVKDTKGSGSVTLNSQSVLNAIESFVNLVEQNPDFQVEFHFFTTSGITEEQKLSDRPAGMAGLKYWRKAAAGADASPLREVLKADKFSQSVRYFSKTRDDAELRRDLFTRIHWHCGQPNSSALREELEARLVVVGRERFHLPAQKASQLADHLVYKVLGKSILKDAQQRVLTRADLYSLIDNVTLVPVPHQAFEMIASALPAALVRNLDAAGPISVADTRWLTDGLELPVRRGTITRSAVESAVANALRDSSVCVLVGGSGIGKSVVSHTVAKSQADRFFIADFRNTAVEETRDRLDMVFGLVGGLPSSTLILEDLNHIEDTQVVLSLARVIEASRRRHRQVIITCYREPALGALAGIGLDQGCIVRCPYFSEQETRELVRNHGGDPDTWGPLAHTVGHLGHPNLTHAFVIGAKARGWPVQEINSVISNGLSSEDIDATREATRRSLALRLPENTRNLLYRISLTTSRFNRSLALTVGEIPPQISRTGECLDQLIGPWIEAIGKDMFRVSPLASKFGQEMLSPSEQRRIHGTIAVQMVSNGAIDAMDINSIIIHARAGDLPEILARLAYSLFSLDARTLETLAEYPLIFRFFRTDQPIYPKELFSSGMLRLIQFKLATAAGDGSRLAEIATALFREISRLSEDEPRQALEAMSLGIVLNTKGIANHLDGWLSLLVRLKYLSVSNPFVRDFIAFLDDAAEASSSNLWGGLFSVGCDNLDSVDRLEHLINQLDELDPKNRALVLTPLDRTFSDYAVFINSPWARHVNNENFDPVATAASYQRMGEKTRGWGIRALTFQCSVAQAIIVDEYQSNSEGALAVLDETEAAMGGDVILSRAKAKIYRRRGEHSMAFGIFQDIVKQAGRDDPVDRAQALREAGISAAKCADWSQAEEWFLDAQIAAGSAPGDDMKLMSIGLGADSALAALEAGYEERALRRLAEAVGSLAEVNPEATLQAAHRHQIIRYAVLRAHFCIEKRSFGISGESIEIEPGSCSIPDPLPRVGEIPLRHIDLTWYMLAEAETAAGLDIGIKATLGDRMVRGLIPFMECSLRLQTIQRDITKLDTSGFAAHIAPYLEAAVYTLSAVGPPNENRDLITPERGHVPTLDKHPPYDPRAEQAAKHAILAYGVCAALTTPVGPMTDLETAVFNHFQGPFPGKAVFDHWNEKPTSLRDWDRVVATTVKVLLQGGHVNPPDICKAGLNLFVWMDRSDFRNSLTPLLAFWLRSEWKRIMEGEKFRLCTPLTTVPAIEDALTMPENNRRFAARLLLAASKAAGVPLATTYRNSLKAIADGTD